MNSELKSRLTKVGIGLMLVLGIAWLVTPDRGEEDALMMATAVKKGLNQSIRDANESMAERMNIRDSYNVGDLVKGVEAYKHQLSVNQEKAIEAIEYVELKNKEAQPQHVIDACVTRIESLKALNAEQKQVQHKAEELYEATLAYWEKLAAQPDEEAQKIKRMEEIYASLEEKLKQAEVGKKNTDSGWEARDLYVQIIRRIKRVRLLIQSELQIRRKGWDEQDSYRRQVIGDDKKVNHELPKMQAINALMAEIREYEPHKEELQLPILKVAPPPPVFKPDMVLAGTSDLPETLLIPLVELWLHENKAQPLHGTRFVWEQSKNGHKEIEVNVPAELQGQEAGKLRIRVLSSVDAAAGFTGLGQQGDIDMLLTGCRPTSEMLAAWLPEGRDLQDLDQETHGRAFRARVCYDALVFFRGNGLTVSTVRSSALKEHGKVFSVTNQARMEAVTICGMHPTATDVEETETVRREALCAKYPDKIVLGVWHQDAVGNLTVKQVPAICYAAGWESEEAQKNIPPDYRPDVDGVVPSPDNIASGRYAYSYSIYWYRSTKNVESKIALLTHKLLSFIANVENTHVADKIQAQGYVPVRLGLDDMSRTNRLTRNDIPLPALIKKMGRSLATEYGYDADETEWVYGVRVPLPLYYELGKVEASDENVVLDPDATYYTNTQAFAKIRDAVGEGKAMIVVLGHADPQWGKKLDVSLHSWLNNLKLSERRADIVSRKKVQPQMRDATHIKHVSLGSSWARPACDISLALGVPDQVAALSRCRRVEIFIVFPVPREIATLNHGK